MEEFLMTGVFARGGLLAAALAIVKVGRLEAAVVFRG